MKHAIKTIHFVEIPVGPMKRSAAPIGSRA